MCQLLAPVLIVNRLLFFFFCCGHLQNYWSKQGRRYMPLSSLYCLDVYDSKPVKQVVNGTVILPPLVFLVQRLFVQNKMNLFLKMFYNLIYNYNYLQAGTNKLLFTLDIKNVKLGQSTWLGLGKRSCNLIIK
jgi:hypothetical protein